MNEAELQQIATRMNVGEWLGGERGYADSKWADGDNRAKAIQSMTEDPKGEWYADYVRAYLHRAAVLGLDTPLGRQALGKAIVTARHMLETAVQVYGPMPPPGVPSGEIAAGWEAAR